MLMFVFVPNKSYFIFVNTWHLKFILFYYEITNNLEIGRLLLFVGNYVGNIKQMTNGISLKLFL